MRFTIRTDSACCDAVTLGKELVADFIMKDVAPLLLPAIQAGSNARGSICGSDFLLVKWTLLYLNHVIGMVKSPLLQRCFIEGILSDQQPSNGSEIAAPPPKLKQTLITYIDGPNEGVALASLTLFDTILSTHTRFVSVLCADMPSEITRCAVYWALFNSCISPFIVATKYLSAHIATFCAGGAESPVRRLADSTRSCSLR